MEQTNNYQKHQTHRFSLTTLLVAGAIIGLAVILIFILPVINHPHPSWPKLWMIRPLLVTPLAGASAGLWYYILDNIRHKGGWMTILAYALSAIGLVIAIWMGIVLGLAGTMWH